MTPANQPRGLREYLRLVWRWKWLALACVLIIPLTVYLSSSVSTKVYESSTKLLVQPGTSPRAVLNPVAAATPTIQQTVLATAQVIKSPAVALQAGSSLRPRATPEEILGSLTVTPDAASGILTLTVSAHTGARAAAIANAVAGGLATSRLGALRAQVSTALTQLRKQLAAIKRPTSPEAIALAEQINQISAFRAIRDSGVEVIRPAVSPNSPASPRPVRDTALALLVSILLALALVALATNLDQRVRETSDIEAALGIPVLAPISRGAFSSPAGDPEYAEEFQLLRASLTYFNVDRPVDTMLVTSAVKGEGKTTTAVNLALAWAKTGKNVVLVDADLRHPRVGDALTISARGGLTNVLLGQTKLSEALVDISLERTQGRLRVLPAGSAPPNPAEILASERLGGVLQQLSSDADLVVMDTSPVLAVSDALSLTKRVGGVLLVARLGQSRRDALVRLKQVLDAAGTKVLGVAATGALSPQAYGYGYGYQESRDADKGPRVELGATPVGGARAERQTGDGEVAPSAASGVVQLAEPPVRQDADEEMLRPRAGADDEMLGPRAVNDGSSAVGRPTTRPASRSVSRLLRQVRKLGASVLRPRR